MFDHPFGTEMLPNVPCKALHCGFGPFPCPVRGSQGEELSTLFSTSPPQEAIKNNQVTPQPPPELKTSAAPLRPFLPALSPALVPLDTLKDLLILPKLQGAELPTVT